MNHTRAFALQLRTAAEVTPRDIIRAADHIDLLMDIIEGQRGKATPATAAQVTKGLRDLRGWHRSQADRFVDTSAGDWHRRQVETLNGYFPEGDKL